MNIREILYTLNSSSVTNFNWDGLWHPPINNYLDMNDISYLHDIASSTKHSAKIKEKYSAIDGLMRSRGFLKFAGGTNRVIYRYQEDDTFLFKIAIDKVGLFDNHAEYRTQYILKPEVTKMFDVTQCGSVGMSEKVQPITTMEDFYSVANYIFDTIVFKFIGKYVIDDIGTEYFLNWGIRIGYGPVLLDYPYVYELDSNKLRCNKVDRTTRIMCRGKIDYDSGFNNLVCTKCGKPYLAKELELKEPTRLAYEEEDNIMKVRIINADGTELNPGRSSDYITQPAKACVPKHHNTELKVRIVYEGEEDEVAEDVIEEEPEKIKEVELDDEPVGNIHSNFIPKETNESLDIEDDEEEGYEQYNIKTRPSKIAKFNKNIENY